MPIFRKTNQDMDTIFIRNVIKSKGVSQKAVAELLFPDNKFPENALRRFFRGKTKLSAEQAKRLADYIGITVDDLYSENGWRVTSDKNKHTFIKEDFRAEIDLETGIAKVYHSDTPVAEKMLVKSVISLKEFIESIDEIILNYKNHESKN